MVTHFFLKIPACKALCDAMRLHHLYHTGLFPDDNIIAVKIRNGKDRLSVQSLMEKIIKSRSHVLSIKFS